MGNPSLKFKKTTVEVNGFYFNVSMTVFCEKFENQKTKIPDSVIGRMVKHIRELAYDQIMDTVFYFDPFVSNERERIDLLYYLRQLIGDVMASNFTLPECWRTLLSGKIGGSAPIPIAKEHYFGVAYVYQTMIDLIECRIEGEYLQRQRCPNDWEPVSQFISRL